MAAQPSGEPGQEHVESLIDDLIRNIFNEAGQSTGSGGLGRSAAAALIETATAAPRGAAHAPMLERLLLAEALASALADSLAPALAQALAPRIMKVLEQSTPESGAKA